MAYEQKPNTGSLFKNERKTGDSHPNATGSALIDGVDYWVSAWTKEGAKGKWQSLAFTRKDAMPQDKPKPKTDGGLSDMPDDLPFLSASLADDVTWKKLTFKAE